MQDVQLSGSHYNDINVKTLMVHHLAAWLTILAIFMLMVASQNDMDTKKYGEALAIFFTFPPIVLASYWIIDRDWHVGLRAAAAILAVFSYSAIIHWLVVDAFSEQPFSQHLTNYIFVAFIGITFRAAGKSVRLGRARELAEQRALSSQLAPHTLYNLLNIIYSAAVSDSDRAGKLVLRLSAMMRHLTLSTENDFVSAAKEWEFIEDYAAFARERTPYDIDMDLLFEGDEDALLPSMLCASLFENAVKHALASKNFMIRARLEMKPIGFVFYVENSMGDQGEEVSGLGLGHAAVKSKLKHLYGRKHHFKIGTETEHYQVEIAAW